MYISFVSVVYVVIDIIILWFYSQMEEHEKALNILISKLGDTKEAEHYCTINSRVCLLYAVF